MELMSPSDQDSGVSVARRFADASEAEWPSHFEALRRAHQLSAAIREINQLLADPANCELAVAALRRMGLDRCG